MASELRFVSCASCFRPASSILASSRKRSRRPGDGADLPDARIGDAAAGESESFEVRQRQQIRDVGIAGRNAVAGQIDADQIAGVVKAELSASAANAADGSFELRVHSLPASSRRGSVRTRDFSVRSRQPHRVHRRGRSEQIRQSRIIDSAHLFIVR